MDNRTRRRFLGTVGLTGVGGFLGGCQSNQSSNRNGGDATETRTEPSEDTQQEATEEPVELPRVIGESEIPSFDSVYTPGEWAPENYENVMEGVDVSGIENEYDTRVGQVRNLMVEVMSSEEYRRDQHGAILAGLNAVHELSWADEETMFADDVTTTIRL